MAHELEGTGRLFKALAHPTRLRILAMLRGGELCVCQVTAVLGLAPSTVSAHLTELRRAGLLQERREGRWIHLRLATDPESSGLLDLVWQRLEGDPTVRTDAEHTAGLRKVAPEVVCAPGFTLPGADD